MKNELIICIVERGKSNPVCKAAVQAGAQGATIVYGRGSGELTYSFFHSLNVDASKEVIYILIPESLHQTVFSAVCKAAEIAQKGRGIEFAIPVLESSLDAIAQPE